MMTAFEQMKAAVDAATAGEWRATPRGGIYGVVEAGGLSENDLAAIVAALNWLRGGGIEQYEQMRLAAQRLRDAQRAYMKDRGNDDLGKEVARRAEALDAALAATEEAK